MDISKASNFERFVYDLVGRDAERVRALFHKVDTQGGFDLSGKPGSDGDEFEQVAQYGFVSGKSTAPGPPGDDPRRAATTTA